MTDGPDPERMARLEKRLTAVKAAHAPKPPKEDHISQAQQGWRMVTELVAGLLLGFGIGYGLDHAFGTMPLFLVLFTFFGFAAGVRTMMRTAGEVARKNAAIDAASKGTTDGD